MRKASLVVCVVFLDICFHSYGCVPGSRISGSYGNFMFNALWNHPTVLQDTYTFMLPPALNGSCISSTPSSVLSVAFVSHYSLPCRRSGIFLWVLTCILLMIHDAEHFFMCLSVIYTSSWEGYLFKSLGQFWMGFFIFFVLMHYKLPLYTFTLNSSRWCEICAGILQIQPVSLGEHSSWGSLVAR